uniref:Uncharacterized protein n=1 Tax=Timema tahoe TaxID=61484 RepID=A0A7R9P0F1_9NEOP|nr:unnamed protein product [Timema tahoe]
MIWWLYPETITNEPQLIDTGALKLLPTNAGKVRSSHVFCFSARHECTCPSLAATPSSILIISTPSEPDLGHYGVKGSRNQGLLELAPAAAGLLSSFLQLWVHYMRSYYPTARIRIKNDWYGIVFGSSRQMGWFNCTYLTVL